MRIAYLLVLLVLMAGFSSAAFAKEKIIIDMQGMGISDEKAQLIEEYLNHKNIGSFFDAMVDDILEKAVERFKMSKEQKRQLDREIRFSQEEKSAAITKIAKAVDGRYTMDELKAYNSFVSSKDGKTYMEKSSREVEDVKNILMQSSAPKLGRFFETMVKIKIEEEK